MPSVVANGKIGTPAQSNWSRPYLSAPLWIYLTVMAPICALQTFLILSRSPGWMQWTSGVVLALTLHNLIRGYLRRIVVTSQGVAFKGIFLRRNIPWKRVRRIGVYVPGGGVGVSDYLYVTTKDTPPAGKWDQDAESIQVQNRPGLLEAIEELRQQN